MEDLFDRFQAITGISKYSNSEVITPQNIVKDMVDLLPASVFNKEAKFLTQQSRVVDFLQRFTNAALRLLIAMVPEDWLLLWRPA